MPDWETAKQLADEYADNHDTDVLLCSGPMAFELVDEIHQRLARVQRSRLLLILTTEGGNAHVAYRIARILQNTYERVCVFVSGWCKSAGTLLAVCGHELVVGDRGELGPIDSQRGRTDDLWESTSGLTETAALRTLEEFAWTLFRRLVTETKALSNGQITFKAAAEAAVPLVAGMLEPIYGQIDPLKLGENARALDIAGDYAIRLNDHSGNVDTTRMGIEALVSGYPDHGFVIDRKEASMLFRNVSEPSHEQQAIAEALGRVAVYPPDAGYPVLTFLNQEPPTEEETDGAQNAAGIEADGKPGPKPTDPSANGADASAEDAE